MGTGFGEHRGGFAGGYGGGFGGEHVHPGHPRHVLRAYGGRGLFITGTNTDVGKTTVTAALAGAMRQARARVGVCKPVASGCPTCADLGNERQGPLGDDDFSSPDAMVAARMAGLDAEDRGLMRYLSPVRFATPLSPHLAAQLEGRKTDWHRVATALDWWQENCEVLLVEGAGGWMVPLDENDFMVSDLAAVLKLPVVVVTTPELGTLNNTLLTVHAIRERGLTVVGIVVNKVADREELVTKGNLAELPRLCGVPLRAVLPATAEGLGDRVPESFVEALVPFAREWMRLGGDGQE